LIDALSASSPRLSRAFASIRKSETWMRVTSNDEHGHDEPEIAKM